MIRFFKNCELDLFAIPITLNREGKKKANSRHGILLTFLFVGFIIWLIYSVSQELFVKKNPNTISYDSFQEVPPSMELNKETFPLAFGLQLPSSLGLSFFKDEEVYYPDVKLIVSKTILESDGTYTKTLDLIEIEVETCVPQHFGENWRLFSNGPVYSLYCIKPDQKFGQLIIEGIEDITAYQGFRIGIRKCENTATVTCKPDDEIKEKLTGSWLNLIYLQSAINPQNFLHPNQRFISYYATTLSPSQYKSATFKLTHLNVIDDDGWLFETNKVKNFIKLNTPTEFLDLTPDEDGFLWKGFIDLGQMITTYERKYTRLQTVLAQIQGSAATVILVLIIVLHPFSQVKFNETLINELFDVKMKKKGLEEKKRAKKGKNSKAEEEMTKVKQKARKKPLQNRNQDTKPMETIALSSDRPLITLKNKEEEEKSPERGVTENKLLSVQSFKTILSSIDDEAESPVPYRQKPALTLSKHFASVQVKDMTSSGEKSDNRLSLAMKKPEKIKPSPLSDDFSDGPETPRKMSEISLTEEKKQNQNKGQEISFGGEKKMESIQNNNQRPIETMISPLSPLSPLSEKQSHISLGMVELKENDGKELSEEDDDKIEEVIQEDEDKEDSSKYESSNIDISIWEYFSSFIMKNEQTKEKFKVLDIGMKNVRERMDILNIMKKFRELDKLKTLLLEEDQLILFNAIPKAEIKSSVETKVMLKSLSQEDLPSSNTVSQRILRKSEFIELDEDQKQVRKSFEKIQMKIKKSKIDDRLLEIFNEISSKK